MGAQILVKSPNIGPNVRFFVTFKFNSLVLLEIAEDDSLEHYLYKTLEKFFGAPNLFIFARSFMLG